MPHTQRPPDSTTSASVQNPSNSLALSATANWEVDLWGRLSQASSGAQASLQASADDLAAARLSAQALLAQTYFSMRAADAQASLLERSVLGYQRSLDLTQVRYAGGVAARTDVLQAETQLKSAQAQLADTMAQRAQLGTPSRCWLVWRICRRPRTIRDLRPHAVPRMLAPPLLERRPLDRRRAEQGGGAYTSGWTSAFFPPHAVGHRGFFDRARQAGMRRIVVAPAPRWRA